MYFDDAVVYSNTWEKHVHRIRQLFDRLRDARLTVNLAKCEFTKATVTYHGKVVGQGQVRPVQAKVTAIEQYPTPTTKKKLMRFLGLVGDVGAGAVLLQRDGNSVEHPVSFFSRKFNSYQLNYSVIEKETLALVWALQHFEVYVNSSAPLTVYTDHNPLTFLNSVTCPNHRLMRWFLFLQSYCLNICHIKGSENIVADALSRAPSS